MDKFLLFLLIILTIFFFYNFYIFHLHFPGINNLCDLLYSYGLQIQAEILQNIRLTAVLWKSGKQNPGIHINSSGCLRQNILLAASSEHVWKTAGRHVKFRQLAVTGSASCYETMPAVSFSGKQSADL